jgi:hypothetical protein
VRPAGAYVPICMSVYVYVYVCLYAYMPICLCAYMSICLYAYMPICLMLILCIKPTSVYYENVLNPPLSTVFLYDLQEYPKDVFSQLVVNLQHASALLWSDKAKRRYVSKTHTKYCLFNILTYNIYVFLLLLWSDKAKRR